MKMTTITTTKMSEEDEDSVPQEKEDDKNKCRVVRHRSHYAPALKQAV
jgi:hypothetical protein